MNDCRVKILDYCSKIRDYCVKIRAWDPVWGPNDKIYHLASVSRANKPFWHLPAYLCEEFLPKYIPSRQLINCAGSF